MDLWLGIGEAARLLWELDPDLFEIIALSLKVTGLATLIAACFALPLGAALAFLSFPGRGALIGLLNALMGIPPVVVGLFVYVLFSRAGPLGTLNLLYTPAAMVIAQIIIVTPLIASIAHRALADRWVQLRDLLLVLGARRWQQGATLLWEGRRALMTALLAGFGRAIGEVGAIMIVGGNIDHTTRVLTTAIALETSRGAFATALALGFVLLFLALGVNFAARLIAREGERPS